jgi:copper chaperone CopZ
MRLEGIEDELPGILAIRASYQRQTLVVEYDEALVTEADIRQAVATKGYTIQPV